MLVEYKGSPRAILRAVDECGIETYDLLSLPRRLLGMNSNIPLVELFIDKRRVKSLRTPAELLMSLPEGDNWLAMTARTLGRLYAAFLLAEDPQRRLDAHKAATLMHQLSLVQHILGQRNLRKVMIGDEVGLGKTIEAGLLIRRLMDQDPGLRVLYLAPARLVSNVTHELREKLDLDARKWVAGSAGDARLESDQLVVASIHRAVFGDNFDCMLKVRPWDVLIIDECHHLSDWGPTGGKPNQAFRLVSQLAKKQSPEGRLILMSGTPHQGSEVRFTNLLRLLSDNDDLEGARGRIIFRTKDRVRDWRNQPLFPSRDIRQTTLVPLGAKYERWYAGISELYGQPSEKGGRYRAASWAKGQALQWAASSVQAGLGFLVRLAMRRLKWGLHEPPLKKAITALRPYREGAVDEPLPVLYARLQKQIGWQAGIDDAVADSEEIDDEPWTPDARLLASLLNEGVLLLSTDAALAKWEALCKIIDTSEGEKIVLFAQPVETVGVVAAFLEKRYRERPATIIGNQSDAERSEQVRMFQSDSGPRFLVSSRAGGEGLNMQRARRLVHLDVPWNPMEMEQRVGRVHRFGSRKTIIVDTVVAAGSREVDMYRIAREKLACIARQLDPEQFEILFSRVMSLVPPDELVDIVGASPGPMGAEESDEIGVLVTEGFRSWNDFDNAYRHEADQIRALETGQASWADVGHFLTKFGNATPADDVSLATFEFRNEQIEAVNQQLPAVKIEGRTFVCGDTGGLPVDTSTGDRAFALGLNLDEISSTLRAAFMPNGESGGALVRRSQEFDHHMPNSVRTLMVFLRQSIRYTGGMASESNVSFHLFAVRDDAHFEEMSPKARGDIVRLLMQAKRVKGRPDMSRAVDMTELEKTIAGNLRALTNKEIAEGTRHCIWPVAIVGLV